MADNNILQGFQVGLQWGAQNLRMQELRSEAALRRLREQAAAEELRMNIEKNNLAIQERADMQKAVRAAQDVSSPTIMVPGVDGSGTFEIPNPNPLTKEQAAMRFVLPVVAQYRPDKVPDFLEGVALAEYRKKTENFQPSGKTITLPQSGRVVEGIQTSPNTFTPVIEPEITQKVDPATGRPVSILRTGTSSARTIPTDVEGRQQRVGLTKWALQNAPELMETDENGMVFLPPEKFNEAARRSGIPGAVKTSMAEQMAATAGAFEVGRKLLPLLTPENVGVRGAISRKLVESGVAQMFPEMRIGGATETLSVASNFRAGLVRALRSDGNINKDEREQIIEGLPTPDQMLSSVQDSKIKLASQLELAAIKSRAAANTLGRQITPFFLKINEIEQMVISNSITPEEGAALWNNNAWHLVEQIRADVQR